MLIHTPQHTLDFHINDNFINIHMHIFKLNSKQTQLFGENISCAIQVLSAEKEKNIPYINFAKAGDNKWISKDLLEDNSSVILNLYRDTRIQA